MDTPATACDGRETGARSAPLLTLILCSRNDRYMGDSVWRLQTALNYVARRVAELNRLHQVEILVTDWGSETPLRDVLLLNDAASRIVSFVHVPPAISRPLQKDSPFPEVLALNAAARRARGAYVGRIDQDTLVGPRFLRWFFDAAEGRCSVGVPLAEALLFSNHRRVPYGFSSMCPPLEDIERFVQWFGARLMNDHTNPRAPFYSAGVGIWLLPRAVWEECGGYDEQMIYMNKMEVAMVERLTRKYRLIDAGAVLRHDFYHLEHYHPRAVRRSSSHRKVNPHATGTPPFRLNGGDWGLAAYPLEAETARPVEPSSSPAGPGSGWSFLATLASAAPRLARDVAIRQERALGQAAREFGERWIRRARRAWAAVS